ncbi:C-type mannose receptor 2-like [Branchiostoma floridae]|uniref:C-type mannose receptor 2-like n=2 Tax=Branchiostoma floridae TaxID=7739 RepID=A0A9J7HSL3_BRAFL|nr:C-type mannose receptor 2-like [Branchiostoma floridae]
MYTDTMACTPGFWKWTALVLIVTTATVNAQERDTSYLTAYNGWHYYKVPVTGEMTSANVKATCEAAGYVTPCPGDSACSFSSSSCFQTGLVICSAPMGEVSQQLCGTNPGGCSQLHGVYQFMNNYNSGATCGAESGSWCVIGNGQQDKYAFCARVDDGWSNWTAWSGCSVTCGVGTETRDRTCTNPAPDCVGETQETRQCDTGVPCLESPTSAPGCGGVLTAPPGGTVTSPNYPDNYGNDETCDWTITVPEGSTVLLSIDSFDLEDGFDFLTIYDGGSDGTTELQSLTGQLSSVNPITSTSNQMFVRFTSDGSIAGRGFEFSYTELVCHAPGYTSFHGVCYKDFAEEITYEEARQTCETDGGLLAMPKDNATNTFIHELGGTSGPRWIGLTDANSEGQWVFADGQTLASAGYNNWRSGEPNNAGNEDCVEVIDTGHDWYDVPCERPMGFVCQLACPAGYVRFNTGCYKDFAEQKTYDEARQTCAEDWGLLAMPKDSATNTFINELGGTTDVRWIGLTDRNDEGQWVFEDGQTLASTGYNNWNPGEPNDEGGDEDCVIVVGTAHIWNDIQCSDTRGFICQITIVDGDWSSWGPWPACSVTCGVGTETRVRTCTNPAPANGGADCVGLAEGTRNCDTGVSCPVDGDWSSWAAWSGCSVTCGVGTETRDRTCNNPAPANGGADCVGQTQETRLCDTGASCPGCHLQNPIFPTDTFAVYNGHCHWYSMTRTSFTDAETFCNSRKARLVMIKDSAKQQWLENLYTNTLPRRNFWIGLDDRDEKNFKWSDGTDFDVANDYSNWNKRSPPKRHKKRDCVLIHRVRKKWVLVNCKKRSRFICEIP